MIEMSRKLIQAVNGSNFLSGEREKEKIFQYYVNHSKFCDEILFCSIFFRMQKWCDNSCCNRWQKKKKKKKCSIHQWTGLYAKWIYINSIFFIAMHIIIIESWGSVELSIKTNFVCKKRLKMRIHSMNRFFSVWQKRSFLAFCYFFTLWWCLL